MSMNAQDVDSFDSDPLARLGLIDPRTGSALETDDWSPPEEGTPPSQNSQRPIRQPVEESRAFDGTDDETDENGDPIQRQPAAQKPAENQWESDDNPYKKQYRELQSKMGPADPSVNARQTFEQRTQSLARERDQAVELLASRPHPEFGNQPMPRQVAEIVGNALYSAAVAQAQLEHDRAVLGPTARRAVAEQIAGEHSVGGVKIEVSELMDLPTPEAMKAKAETLRDTRRDSTFQSRKNGRRDRAESGAPTSRATSKEVDELSPMSKIALGIARGQV